MEQIPFTRPQFTEIEESSLLNSLHSFRLEGDGPISKKIHGYFESTYGIKRALLTTSCTDALEMSALLADIKPGDEVIVPSYTFVSTAHAFALRGAKIVFCDSLENHPNMDHKTLPQLINTKTKAIVVVHYAGFACEMEFINNIAKEKNLLVVEDAAQGIEAKYKNKYLGTLADLGAFSFHQTKNLTCGEGGLLAINNSHFTSRAEIIREKGTNRSAFFRGEVDKYTCVDIGSSYLLSDLNASLLWGQIQRKEQIQNRRKEIWQRYYQELSGLSAQGAFLLPELLPNREHNAHCFFLTLPDLSARTKLLAFLKEKGISATFHYVSLHTSPFYGKNHDQERKLPHALRYTDCLLRLPLFETLTPTQQDYIIEMILSFYKTQRGRS